MFSRIFCLFSNVHIEKSMEINEYADKIVLIVFKFELITF